MSIALNDQFIAGIRHMQQYVQGDPDAVPPVVPLMNWRGADYPCAAGDQKFGRTLGIGGYLVDADLILVCVVSDFPGGAGPQGKKDVIYYPGPGAGGAKYRVDYSQTLPGGGVLVLVLTNDTKGM